MKEKLYDPEETKKIWYYNDDIGDRDEKGNVRVRVYYKEDYAKQIR